MPSASADAGVLIVGAGQAGGRAAEALRASELMMARSPSSVTKSICRMNALRYRRSFCTMPPYIASTGYGLSSGIVNAPLP